MLENKKGENGVWFRWIIEIILGLGAVGTTLFYMGQWSGEINSQIKAISVAASLMDNRITRVENEGSPAIQKKIIAIEKDNAYIVKSLENNDKAHAEIIIELKDIKKIIR